MTSRKALVDQAIAFQESRADSALVRQCDQTEGDVMVYHLSLDRAGRLGRQ